MIRTNFSTFRRLSLAVAAVALMTALPLQAVSVRAEESVVSASADEGTVIYDGNDVAVAAALADNEIRLQIRNDSQQPVVVSLNGIIANDVTLEIPITTELWLMQENIRMMAGYGEEMLASDGYYYVEAGGTREVRRSFGSDLKAHFGCENVGSLQLSVSVVGLSQTLNFDGTDDVMSLSFPFEETGEMTEVAVPGGAWDGDWQVVDGTLLYESGEVCLYQTGIDRIFEDDDVWFGLVLENRTDKIVEVEVPYDTVPLINGFGSENAYTLLKAYPGTRAYDTMSIDTSELSIKEEADVQSAYCQLTLEDEDRNELGQAEFVYGQDTEGASSLAEALKEEAAEARKQELQEEEAAERAEAAALLDFTVEEQTIYESDGFTVRVTGAGYEEDQDFTLLYFEVTNTTDKDVTVSLASVDGEVIGEDHYFYVNGCQVLNSSVYIDAPAGETVSDTGYFSTRALEAVGIENVGEIELEFSFYDENFESVAEQMPSVIRTSEYDNMDTELSEDLHLLYDEGGFSIRAKYIPAGEEGLASVVYAVSNNSESAAGISMRSFKVNGVEDEDSLYHFYRSAYELPGRTYVTRSSIRPDFLTEQGITAVEQLSVRIDFTGAQRGDFTPVLEAGELNIPLE